MGQVVRLHGEQGLRLGVRLSDDYCRSVAVWKEESLVARADLVFLAFVAVVLPIACSPQRQSHRLATWFKFGFWILPRGDLIVKVRQDHFFWFESEMRQD
jgi:hypothetical protein